MRYGYIYKTTNLVNNKSYIGQHKCDHFDNSYIGSGIRLQEAIKKYGKENFLCEVLEWCDSAETLNAAEIKYIAQFNATESDEFYNIASGGNVWGSPKLPETREKLRQSIINMDPAKKEHARYLNSEKHKGIVQSEESNKKRSEKLRGRTFSDEAREKMSKYAKNRTAEHQQKISEANSLARKGKPAWNKDKKMNESYREIHRQAHLGKEPGNKGKKCFNNGIHNMYAYECPVGYVPGFLRKAKIVD